ncbi:MAG: 3-hydroxyacyl-ACP dehydratase FabZ [Campylobacteraceae bacterium]|jgi:3-hydroxyacyl-[acyl-carrier-protein] dehydratase|nr:3-hydroxyacyl-ACP dehydratase FabZ [Campylobacteraceae bacterium]MBT3882681.1 3-hydroxyacyl-ACP dehydratase FabZ [Campylobacteraceae bacterium]MBT4030407.1 3-hydroxyacyl-ACP dehydratase FabZ [Campylobacteraceae bacterium]MBT4178972.1 3-hydroxyacyl-ACP dehydratase FabZ [Campylobacteraceae bacterium]MBT4707863.1 3-hydroxyacyl-ACP dehydratase FabZ [Campylobacteraceae bacterium]
MLDVVEIQEILPHRYPFLLVDKVTSMTEKEDIVAYKNVSISEPVFQGHFPGHPIYPGVMILEGMAQAGGILAFKSGGLTNEEIKSKVMYFMSIDGAKFRSPVKPGDKLEYRISVKKLRKTLIVLDGKAYVDDNLVAEAELKAMIVDK